MTNLRTTIEKFGLKPTLSCRRSPAVDPDPARTNRRLLDSVKDMLAVRCSGVDQHDGNQPAEQPVNEKQRLTPRPPPRVLCIDDDPDFVRAVQLRLESRGIAVLRATTGLDGFCCAVGEPMDVILLDHQLPNGCGGYILEQLKTNPTTKDIPVIVISGSKDRALEYTLVNGGAVRYMHKPIDFEELMNELRRHLAVKS